PAVRASTRFDTLAQAMSSTTTTAPSSMRRPGRAARVDSCCIETAVAPQVLPGNPAARVMRRTIAAASALAAESDEPGASRPTTTRLNVPRRLSSPAVNTAGVQSSARDANPKAAGSSAPRGNANPGGITPTTVY